MMVFLKQGGAVQKGLTSVVVQMRREILEAASAADCRTRLLIVAAGDRIQEQPLYRKCRVACGRRGPRE